MASIASRTLVLPTRFDRLVELETYVAELFKHIPDLPEAEVIQYNIVLALHELCVNIIKHAYDGEDGDFTVTFQLLGNPLCVQIDTIDAGSGEFDWNGWQTPDLDDPPIHGLGVYLMRQLMDSVEYKRTEGCNHWRLIKFVSESA